MSETPSPVPTATPVPAPSPVPESVVSTAPGPAVEPIPATNGKATAVKKEPKVRKARTPKEPKAPKPPKEPGAHRTRHPKFPDEHIITVLKPNAKSQGAAERFSHYFTGQTVKAYLEKMATFERTSGQTMADMRWDEKHQFIAIAETVVTAPTQPAPSAAPAEPASPAA